MTRIHELKNIYYLLIQNVKSKQTEAKIARITKDKIQINKIHTITIPFAERMGKNC